METEKLNECKQQINVAASREALVFSKLAYKLTLASWKHTNAMQKQEKKLKTPKQKYY